MKMRKLSGLILLLALLLGLALSAAAAQPEALLAADTLGDLGLFHGTGLQSDGTVNYALDRAPTRQEAVTMLVRLLGREKEAAGGTWSTPFTDVDGWAAPYVGCAYTAGLTKGTGPDTFGGSRTIRASEYLTLVLRAMGYESGKDFQWDSAWTLSDALGVTDGRYGANTVSFTRADVALVSRNALAAKTKSGAPLASVLGLKLPPSDLIVTFLDVGQADCILAGSDGHYLLVDAGNNADGGTVVSYLKARGVTSLDCVIGTHPHEDHIGGLDDVLRAFPVGELILPDKTAATASYEDVLDAAAEKNLSVTAPKVGTTVTLGSASYTIVAPNGDYGDELNNWSVGVRLSCGKNSFLLCGDAEAQAEADMLKNGQTLRADVLKVSHHGSNSSTTQAFLSAVDPDWAVISCGAGNDYGHPGAKTLSRLKAAGVKLFRTDEQGTVTAVSDGISLAWSAAAVADTAAHPGSASENTSAGTGKTSYVLNTSTKKFHRPDCRAVSAISAANRQTTDQDRAALIAAGYAPCGICEP